MKTKIKFSYLQRDPLEYLLGLRASFAVKRNGCYVQMVLHYSTNTGILCLMVHIIEFSKYFSILTYLNENFYLKLAVFSYKYYHSWRKGKVLSHQNDLYSELLVAPSCLTLCKPMDCSPAASSVHGILQQARILEWFAISFSRG